MDGLVGMIRMVGMVHTRDGGLIGMFEMVWMFRMVRLELLEY